MKRGFALCVSLCLTAALLVLFAACGEKTDADAEAVQGALAALVYPEETKQDLELAKTSAQFEGVTFSYASSDESVLTAEGAVTRATEDRNATLTATAVKGEATAQREFDITVLARAATDEEMVAEVLEGLSLPQSVSDDVYLPAYDYETGARIAWESEDEALISMYGHVTRPAYGEEDAAAVLVATVTKGKASGTRSFEVIVEAQGLDGAPVNVQTAAYALRAEEDSVILRIEGSAYIMEGNDRTFTISVGGGEKSEPLSQDGENFVFECDVTSLPVGIWSDVNLYVTETDRLTGIAYERMFEIESASQFEENAVVCGNFGYRIIGYKASGSAVYALKVHKYVNAQVTERTNANTYFTAENDGGGTRVYLHVEGNASIGADTSAERAIGLLIKNMNGGAAYANTAAGTDTSAFSFKVDVTEIPVGASGSSSWLDITLTLEEGGLTYESGLDQGGVNVFDASALAFSGSLRYRFQIYDGLLKLYAEQSDIPYAVTSANSNATVRFVEEDGALYLVMDGLAWFDEGAQSRTVSLDVAIASSYVTQENLYAGTETGGYFFKADVSSLTANSNWYEPTLVITEDGAEMRTLVNFGSIDSEASAVSFGGKTYTLREANGEVKFTVTND